MLDQAVNLSGVWGLRAARCVPIWALALWADQGFLVLVSRYPFVTAPLAAVAPNADFRHSSMLYLKGIYVNGPPKGLTWYIPCGNILVWRLGKLAESLSPSPSPLSKRVRFGLCPLSREAGPTLLSPARNSPTALALIMKRGVSSASTSTR